MKIRNKILIGILAAAMILGGSAHAYIYNPTTASGGAIIGGAIVAPEVAFGTGANLIGGNASFVFDTTNGRLGVGTASPSFTGDFRGTTTTGTIVHGGAGLNDMTKSGTFTGNTPHTYVVTLAVAGVPDTYSVSKDGTAIILPTNIVAGPVLIDDGISITFAATTGHTAGNTWTFTTTVTGAINTNQALYTNSIKAFSTDLNNNILTGNNAGNLLDTSVSVGNIFTGANAGGESRGGNTNIGIGSLAGFRLTGSDNIVLGTSAFSNATGSNNNVVIGSGAGQNASGSIQNNVLIGLSAGSALTSNNAVFIGNNAGLSVTSGVQNTFVGTTAGSSVLTKDRNSFFGYQAGNATNENDNTFIGNEAGKANTSGNQNTFVGSQAGLTTSSGLRAIAIGYAANAGSNSNDNIVIGTSAGAIGTGAKNTFLGNISGTVAGAGDRNTLIGYNAQQAQVTSSGGTAIGEGAIADTSEFVGGSTTSPKLNIYFGNGKTAAASTPGTQYSINGTGGGGTTANQAGGAINIKGGLATGNATGGEVRIFTSDAGASGTTPQSATENLTCVATNKACFHYGRDIPTQGANVVAANDLTLTNGNVIVVTGNTQINNIISTNWSGAGSLSGGPIVTLLTTGTPTIKNNTAGGGELIFLATSTDVAMVANARIGLQKIEVGGVSSWYEIFRTFP